MFLFLKNYRMKVMIEFSDQLDINYLDLIGH